VATLGIRTPVHRSIAPTSGSNGADGTPLLSMRDGQGDMFLDESGRPRVLRGVCVYSGATRLAELAARVGFDTVWIEMEHGPADFGAVEQLCMAIEAGGGLPAVRVPDGQRHHVLRALEVGARLVIVPMVNTAQQAAELVRFGKFPPAGSRGYNTRSRGVEYGLSPDAAMRAVAAGDARQAIFTAANGRTHLFAQVETGEAVENLDSICATPGLGGIFIGPGDLSVSLGMSGPLDQEPLVGIVADCVRRARAAGKHAGILIPPGRMLDAAVAAGADLLFYGGDVTDLIPTWQRLLSLVPALAATAEKAGPT